MKNQIPMLGNAVAAEVSPRRETHRRTTGERFTLARSERVLLQDRPLMLFEPPLDLLLERRVTRHQR